MVSNLSSARNQYAQQPQFQPQQAQYPPQPNRGFNQTPQQMDFPSPIPQYMPNNQESASATLLDQSRQVDLNEPSPYNQSQLLYNQPLTATINRNDNSASAQKNNYIRYKDGPNQQRPPFQQEQGWSPQQQRVGMNTLQGPVRDHMQTGVFDKSLNDREPAITWSQTRLQHPDSFGQSHKAQATSHHITQSNAYSEPVYDPNF